FGKLAPGLMHLIVLWLAALPWLIGGGLLAAAGGTLGAMLIPGFVSLLTLANGVFTACVTVGFAVRARKPGEAVGKAWASVLLVHALLWGGLAYIASRALSVSSGSVLLVGIAAVIGSAVLLALALSAWRWALSSFRVQRYNEASLRGKGAT
ncbi:MAG: hypothetical protein JWN98_2499, partial [Abditibacteriota bacterium]|nr:hypothetical protein [Abditibacteriota bacterium]